jgi:hypothetical protein
MLHPRRSRSERHSLVHDSKTVSLRPADYSFNVTLSSYQYWEYVEDISAGTGEDTQTDPSVSG